MAESTEQVPAPEDLIVSDEIVEGDSAAEGEKTAIVDGAATAPADSNVAAADAVLNGIYMYNCYHKS